MSNGAGLGAAIYKQLQGELASSGGRREGICHPAGWDLSGKGENSLLGNLWRELMRKDGGGGDRVGLSEGSRIP